MRINHFLLISLLCATAWAVSKHHNRMMKHHKKSSVHKEITLEKYYPEVNSENHQYKPIPAEIRPKNSDHITFKDFRTEMMYRELSPGEMRVIFNALDKDHNNKVTSDEWANFYKLFVVPFEACNKEKNDYLLDEQEVGECLKSHHFEPFQEAYKSMEEISPHIIEMLDKPKSNKINFADYLFLRRVSLSWKKCSLGKLITPLKLPCALRITSPDSSVERGEATHVFELGRLLNRGRNRDRAFLDLLSFLNVAHLFYYFSEFEKPMYELPYMGLVISKAQLHRVIQNQVLPSEMGNDVVENLFNYVKPGSQDIDKITFSEFGVFMFVLRLFSKHATKKFQKFYLEPKGFNAAIADPAFDHFTLQMIDNFETPTYETVKHQLNENFQSNSLNEEQFLISFLEKSRLKKRHSKFYGSSREHSLNRELENASVGKEESEANKENVENKGEKKEFKDTFTNKSNRLMIYNSFGFHSFNLEHKGVNELEFLDFLRFYKLSLCFNNIANYDSLANTNEINAGFKKCFPPMPFYPEEIDDIQYMTQYLSVDKEVNIKEFLSFFNYQKVFGGVGSGQVHTSEKKMVAGIKMLGFQITSEVLDEAREGLEDGEYSSYNYAKGFIKFLEIKSGL